MTWVRTYFSTDEMKCKCGCGRADMNLEFMRQLNNTRATFGHPMIVTSGYRCPEYNASISTTGLDGPHTTGRAVDIKISGPTLVDLLCIALGNNMKGFGFKQHGPHFGRFLHIDDISKRIWTYS